MEVNLGIDLDSCGVEVLSEAGMCAACRRLVFIARVQGLSAVYSFDEFLEACVQVCNPVLHKTFTGNPTSLVHWEPNLPRCSWDPTCVVADIQKRVCGRLTGARSHGHCDARRETGQAGEHAPRDTVI